MGKLGKSKESVEKCLPFGYDQQFAMENGPSMDDLPVFTY